MNLSLIYVDFKTFLRFLSFVNCLWKRLFSYNVKFLWIFLIFLQFSFFLIKFSKILVSFENWFTCWFYKGIAQIVGAATLEPDPAGWAIFVIVIFWGIMAVVCEFWCESEEAGAEWRNPEKLEHRKWAFFGILVWKKNAWFAPYFFY